MTFTCANITQKPQLALIIICFLMLSCRHTDIKSTHLPEINSDINIDTQINTDIKTDSDTKTDIDTITDADTDTDTDSITDTIIDTDTDTDAITDTDAKPDIKTYIENNWQAYGYKEKPNKFIALTFDDGPCPPHFYGGSAALLKILETYKVKATFFVVGENITENAEITHVMAAGGHELGNHSYGHQNLGDNRGFTAAAIERNLKAASQIIKEITGEDPRIMRPPYISFGSAVINTCADMGMAIIIGNDVRDWDKTYTPEMIKNNVFNIARDGGIIIMHDTYAAHNRTILAMPDIITGLRERGYWFLTVSELAELKEITLEAGKIYHHF